MIKNIYILFLCLILSFSCMLSSFGGTVRKIEETEQREPAPIVLTEAEPLTLSVGQASVIDLSNDEEENLKKWTSSNTDVVAVDSGGRVDALKTGTATVTAIFDDKMTECKITVVEGKKEVVDRFSTCITANDDVLKKNLADKNQKNPYKIMVNRKMNCVTVYTYDEKGKYTVPVRAMVCSCGKNNGTITGSYNMYFKNEWHGLIDNVYGKYVSGISGDYLFHSVPYYSKSSDDLEVEEFNKLGTSASKGCVRLSVSDTKWIYDNCENGTAITIYDDDNPGPLGKPDTIKITDLKCGWDPTDDDKHNPYNGKKPRIIGAKSCTVKQGTSFNPLSKIKAVDTCGNDISDDIEVVGNVVASRPGKYKVTYSVTDSLHRSASVDITVTVEDDN